MVCLPVDKDVISIRPFTEAPATRNMTLPFSIFNKPALFEESNSIANISNRQKVRKNWQFLGIVWGQKPDVTSGQLFLLSHEMIIFWSEFPYVSLFYL